jgi:hypothetical protein
MVWLTKHKTFARSTRKCRQPATTSSSSSFCVPRPLASFPTVYQFERKDEKVTRRCGKLVWAAFKNNKQKIFDFLSIICVCFI